MKLHELKTVMPYFSQVKNGYKTFEVRKNDRNFQTYDLLLLKEYDTTNRINHFTGEEILAKITYILEGGQFGIEEGYVILGIKIIETQFNF